MFLLWRKITVICHLKKLHSSNNNNLIYWWHQRSRHQSILIATSTLWAAWLLPLRKWWLDWITNWSRGNDLLTSIFSFSFHDTPEHGSVLHWRNTCTVIIIGQTTCMYGVDVVYPPFCLPLQSLHSRAHMLPVNLTLCTWGPAHSLALWTREKKKK